MFILINKMVNFRGFLKYLYCINKSFLSKREQYIVEDEIEEDKKKNKMKCFLNRYINLFYIKSKL